jgi:predicted RNase H-like HicB family nuclease
MRGASGREGDELKDGTWKSLARKAGWMKYPVIIERAERNFSAYVPDLPGCVATGSTLKEAQKNVQEAVAFHVAGMREDGLTVPLPSAVAFATLAD